MSFLSSTRDRLLKLSMLLASVALLAGCDLRLDEHTRPNDALLTEADLQLAEDNRGDAMIETAGADGACEQVERVFDELEGLSKGRFRFSGQGVMDVDNVVWSSLGQAERGNLLNLLVVQNKCATGDDAGVAVARDIRSQAILVRYRR